MSLINCPECGKEISDKSELCIGCGFPIKMNIENIIKCSFCGSIDIDKEGYCNDCGMKVNIITKERIFNNKEKIYSICPVCNFHNPAGKFVCLKCGHRYKFFEYDIIDETERTCPFCNSAKIRAFKEEKVIVPQKTKIQTSLNLNPLKPFTIFNHKEKVVRKEIAINKTQFICDNCGNIWD